METVLRSIPVSFPFMPKRWRDDFNSWTADGAPVEDAPLARLIEAGMANYALKLPQPARIPKEALATLDMPVLAIICRTIGDARSRRGAGPGGAGFPTRRHPFLSWSEPRHRQRACREIAADIAGFIASPSARQ